MDNMQLQRSTRLVALSTDMLEDGEGGRQQQRSRDVTRSARAHGPARGPCIGPSAHAVRMSESNGLQTATGAEEGPPRVT